MCERNSQEYSARINEGVVVRREVGLRGLRLYPRAASEENYGKRIGSSIWARKNSNLPLMKRRKRKKSLTVVQENGVEALTLGSIRSVAKMEGDGKKECSCMRR